MIDRIHTRLQAWATWRTVGDGSGYSTVNTLHESWSPPTPGRTPTLKTSGGNAEVLRTDAAVRQLSERMQSTVWLVYCRPAMPRAEMAGLLGCAVTTITGRIDEAHRRVAAELEGENVRSNDGGRTVGTLGGQSTG